MASQVFTHLSLFSFFVTGVKAWRCAKYEHYFSQQPDYIDCVWDCCGNSFNRHCCAPIGIIVGCCIVGSVVLAGILTILACWWQKRRARYTKGPKLFHNRRHSHYPVAPSSVTRPAPLLGPDQGVKSPGYMPPRAGYGPPPGQGYGPPPGQGYGPPPDHHSEKPPLDEYFDEKPMMGRVYNEKPVERGYGPPPDRSYGPPSERYNAPVNRGPPRRDNMSSADEFSEYSDFEERGRGSPASRGGLRPAPPPSRPVKPQPKEFIEL